MRGDETCRECKFYAPSDVPKEATAHDYPTQRKDGFCHKVFPRGYIGAGKPGGYVFSGKHHCFQFEIAEETRQNDGGMDHAAYSSGPVHTGPGTDQMQRL